MKFKQIAIATAIALATLAAVSCKKTKKSSENSILEFWVAEVRYQIDPVSNFITHTYAKPAPDTWTGWVSMPAAPRVVLSPGARLDPPATRALNFEQEQTYTVTAENGDKKVYTVKAERAPYFVD